MNKPTVVSRRVIDCIRAMEVNNSEVALMHLFPAVDVTAKRRYPRAGVGERFRRFLNDQEVFVYYTATQNYVANVKVANGMGLADALYKYARHSIVHDGELDERISFDATGTISMGEEWRLSHGFIAGMLVGVAVAEENSKEYVDLPGSFNVFGGRYTVNQLWGREKHFLELMKAQCGVGN